MSLNGEIVVYQTGRGGDMAYRAFVRVGKQDEEDCAIVAGCYGSTEAEARTSVIWKLKQVIEATSPLTKEDR